MLVLTITIAHLNDAYAQDSVAIVNDVYYSDELPDELNRSTFDYLKYKVNKYQQDFSGSNLSSEENFYFELGYLTDQINRGGWVLYNNAIEDYLNNIKDWILELNEIDLEIKVFLIDYPQLNAFTNDFGSIYVTTGAFVRLKTEREMALLLAHEISHVILRHSFKENKYRITLKKEEWNSSKEKENFDTHAFSRRQEFSADSMAINLLKGIVSEEDIKELMFHLEYANNPVGAEDFSLDQLVMENSYLKKKFKALWNDNNKKNIITKVETDDFGSTHPSVENRLDKMIRLNKSFQLDTVVHYSVGNFEFYRGLCCHLYYKTLLHSKKYFDALYLTLNQRKNLPDDNQLMRRQIRLLALLSQEKYLSDSPILSNPYGHSCNDQRYLKMKRFIDKLNPVDLNLMAYTLAADFCEPNDELVREVYALFYAKNYDLYRPSQVGDDYIYTDWKDVLSYRWSNNTLQYKEWVDSLKEKGFEFTEESKKSLLLYDVLKSDISANEMSFIDQQDSIDKKFSSNINLDEFDLGENDPLVIVERYKKKNSFLYSDNFSDSSKSARMIEKYIWVDVKLKPDYLPNTRYEFADYEIAVDKSIRLSEKFVQNSVSDSSILNYTNSSGAENTMFDNYRHRVAMVWLNELSDEDLIISSVQEEMDSLFLNRGIDHLSVVICVAFKRGLLNRPYTIFYELCFDIKSQGVVYMSKIGSKQRLNKYRIEQFNYLSEINKNR